MEIRRRVKIPDTLLRKYALPGKSTFTRCALLVFTFILSGFFQPASEARAVQTQTTNGQSALADDFSNDASLNTALWTTQSALLNRVAAAGEGGNHCFSLPNRFVPPVLNFGLNGMQVSGTDGWQQFTGIQSLRTFSPPFTLTTTVTASIANGDPFELFLISSDSREWFSLYGNVNPANQPYTGIGLACNPSLYQRPAVGVPYTIQISVNANGLFSMSLSSGSVMLAATTTQIGTGPFYLVLGQGEGWPNTEGTKNVAVWRSVTIEAAVGGQGSAPGAAGVWVVQAEASTAPGVAGLIQLEWNLPGATTCQLSVTPALPALPHASPVACQEEQGGVPVAIPSPTGTSAKQYVFELSPSGQSSVSPVTVKVYALPSLTFGPLNVGFSSVTYTQVLPLGNCNQPVNILGCWGEFGISERSPALSSALTDGISEAGIVGYNYVAGGDAAEVNAVYDPLVAFTGIAGYDDYLNVEAQESLVSFGLCNVSAGGVVTLQEGGAGLASYIIASDSDGDSYSGDLAPNYCANLLTPNAGINEFESQVESAFNFGEFLGNTPQEASSLWNSYISVTSSVLQVAVVPSQLENAVSLLSQVVSAVSSAGLTGDIGVSSSSAAQHWQPVLPAGSAYTLSSGVAAVAVEVGFGTVGELSAVMSALKISGVAVPSDPPAWLSRGGKATLRPFPVHFPQYRQHGGVAAPVAVAASARRLDARTAEIDWQQPDGLRALGYRVVWGRSGGKQLHSVALGPDILSHTIRGLEDGSSYVVAVAAKDRLGLDFLACFVVSASAGVPGTRCGGLPPGPVRMPWIAVNSSKARGPVSKAGGNIKLAVSPSAAQPGAVVMVLGVLEGEGGRPLPGISLELTGSEGGTRAPPATVTTASDGSFRLSFTAPPTPGVVTITARIAGMPNSPVATATLHVLPKE